MALLARAPILVIRLRYPSPARAIALDERASVSKLDRWACMLAKWPTSNVFKPSLRIGTLEFRRLCRGPILSRPGWEGRKRKRKRLSKDSSVLSCGKYHNSLSLCTPTNDSRERKITFWAQRESWDSALTLFTSPLAPVIALCPERPADQHCVH